MRMMWFCSGKVFTCHEGIVSVVFILKNDGFYVLKTYFVICSIRYIVIMNMNKITRFKKIRSRYFVIIIVLILSIIILLSWLLISAYSNAKTLQNENSSLQNDNSKLQSDFNEQLENNKSLQNQVDELKAELRDLNREEYNRTTSEMSQAVGVVCGPAPAIENFLKDYKAWSNCVMSHS